MTVGVGVPEHGLLEVNVWLTLTVPDTIGVVQEGGTLISEVEAEYLVTEP